MYQLNLPRISLVRYNYVKKHNILKTKAVNYEPPRQLSTPVVIESKDERATKNIVNPVQNLTAPPLVGADDDRYDAPDVQEMRKQNIMKMVSFCIQNGTSLLLCGAMVYSIIMITSAASSNRGGNMLFTKANVKLYDDKNKPPDVKFDDVAGIDAVKKEVYEVVEFLKNPEKFSRVGASIPKGYLLSGLPGTGKTLLSQSIAGEAGVPFFSCSASSFVEMFVGVGASKVRDLFNKAKENAPCIVFIDEIDAVGKARSGAGPTNGGNDEREQTINQLLTEMNGFEPNAGVIVIAATNRPDILDKALTRPGRFDRQITINLPDVRGRAQILGVHTRNKPLAEDVNLDNIARVTPGFSGADLQHLANEAAIYAARSERDKILACDFDAALEKITIGLERDGAVFSTLKRRVVAIHEAGHAICAVFLDGYDEIKKVTITPRGGTGGVTQFLPSAEVLDSGLYTKDYFEKQLIVALGGRAAEEIMFGKKMITTGASGDMKRVYEIARMMVTHYGFSDEVGTVMWNADYLSPEMAAAIDQEITIIAKKSYESAMDLVKKQRNSLIAVADALIEKETLSGDDVISIVYNKSYKEM